MTTTTKTTIAIEPTMKIIVAKDAANPAREGTAVHARIGAVLRAKRVELAIGRGARMSTVRHCVRTGLVRVQA